VREDLRDRICPVACAPYIIDAPTPENLNTRNGAIGLPMAINQPGSTIPGGGALSTANDIHRFMEMLRRRGELDGVRILSPAMIELMSQNHTGMMRNEAFDHYFQNRNLSDCPGYLGIGFFVRGDTMTNGPFGVLNSPSAFGGAGMGATFAWVDPAYDLSVTFLSTGLMNEAESWNRHAIIADLILSSITSQKLSC
jgi:CubicO group peptidase (beta-lactamase class C family)